MPARSSRHPHHTTHTILIMAPDPRCSALAAAKDKKGESAPPLFALARCSWAHAGLSYTQIAEKMGKPEQHVIDSACRPPFPSRHAR
jgi:hypothetical protein